MSTVSTYLDYLRDVRRMSPNTLSSYARDLSALTTFAEQKGRGVDALTRQDLEAFVRRMMTSGLAPRSVARAIACLRGYYRFMLIEKRITADPAEDLRAPRAWPALPKYLDLAQVDKLLAQPDTTAPRGLRDKALIELLYATGLRVTELLSLRAGDINLDAGYLTCIGKGDKQRIVPLGHSAADWVRRYVAAARPEGVRDQGGGFAGRESPRAAALVCHAPARARCRSPRHPDDARARRSVHDADLYARAGGASAGRVRPVPPPKVGGSANGEP